MVVTADRYLIAAGTYTGTITVASNAAHGDKTIGVTVVVPEIATVTASTDTTGFNYFIDALEVTIQNDGNVTYDYTATSGNNLFAISNASGSLQMGENITLTLTAQRDGLATGTHSDILTITNSKGENTQVAIGLLNFVEEKWLIDNAGFTDAVYDINQDVIVAVYRTDFHVIDPVAETISTLILPESANCVAISPDGTKAVVGHNHYVTHIDMTTKTILNTFYLGSNLIYTYDIELSNDDFAYVVPSSSRYAQNLYKINLQNGNASGVSTGTSWAYNIVAQLHPSGNYVYTTQDDTAPVPMRKYDVSKGNPSFMYTIQNGYSDGGNMWMSTTGDYIFTAYGNVFATTTDATTDLNELGDLTADVISQMDHSAAANKVYTLEYGSGVYEHEMTMVRTYDASTFSHVETIKLPSYILKDDEGGGKVNDAYGLFGFFNSTGTKYYVMAKDAETRSSFSIIEIAVN